MNEEKKTLPQKEEAILKFWQENRIFEKSLEKPAPKGEFIFYEGPPTANGEPGIHHLEARAFKDAIPRYKTMQGFHVRRKGGWDTHGLPVELAVEKALGLKSKKEIETYGIEAFNKKCREDVWKYVKEWEEFTNRIGYWIDLKRPYVTYKPYYIESVWSIVAKINEQGLLYKDYKVVPWCPRCGTALSSHELAQGYEDVKDLSVTVKFKIKNAREILGITDDTYLLTWTTTPWTLLGNVALAVGGKKMDMGTAYKLVSLELNIGKVDVKSDKESYDIGHSAPPGSAEKIDKFLKEHKGKLYIVASPYDITKHFDFPVREDLKFNISREQLSKLKYEPLYPFLKDNLSESEKPKLKNAFKVYAADFVTTTDGTGIVHTAVMYGTDDFELGTKVGLPKHHLVKEDGTFKEEAGFLAGKFVKSEETDVAIIKDLASRGLLFAKEKHSHSYPHCWRCHTPLIYFARDSWYIAMSKLRHKLVKENQKINWEPGYIKDGRFGEWLNEVKDWAISRERYWGTPLPVWQCPSCGKNEIVGSFEKLFRHSKNKKLTRLVLVRHGESEKNILEIFDSSRDGYPLTKAGEKRAKSAGEKIKKLGGADVVFASPVLRTRQTAEIIGKIIGHKPVFSDTLWEVRSGEWDGQKDSVTEAKPDRIAYNKLPHDIYYKTVRGKTGESWQDVENRVVSFAREILAGHAGETVVIVSHEGPLMTLARYLKELSVDDITNLWEENRTINNGLLGGFAEPTSVYVDTRTSKEIDPHRPFIDEITLTCDCEKESKRVKEVMDVWFDSGAMPFAQDHYPFENKDTTDGEIFKKPLGYPADFISEAIDQTRGWFYTLHAIGILLGKGRAYRNVICLGHILDAEGKKMSKSLGNIVDPKIMIEKYGADPLRFWMYSVNAPGEPKNFDEKTVDEIVKKVFNLASNVLAFYQLYADKKVSSFKFQVSSNVLDKWILARLNQLIGEVTDGLEKYKLLEPTRAIRDFIAGLSQWYLRRSRERIKNGGEDGNAALATLGFVLCELSKIMAPFTPFFAEYLYKAVVGEKESVHLESWPEISIAKGQMSYVIVEMNEVRRVVSFALEQRAKANIKVRQPLVLLKIKPKISVHMGDASHSGSGVLNLKSDLLELIKEEVNVKEVLFDKTIQSEVELDTVITPELKEEGNVRELIRTIQELRKEAKLEPGDLVRLEVAAEGAARAFAEKHKEVIMRQTNLSEIVFVASLETEELIIDDMRLRMRIVK